jgi:hypothetical protein
MEERIERLPNKLNISQNVLNVMDSNRFNDNPYNYRYSFLVLINNHLKGLTRFLSMFFASFDRSHVTAPVVRLLHKFRFRIEFFDFRVSA